MDVGGIIRSIRRERGLKSGDLAKVVGVSRSYISRIENENRKLSTPIILRIAEALSVDPQVIMSAARQDKRDQRLAKSVEMLLATRELNPAFAWNLLDFLSESPARSVEIDAWGPGALECAENLFRSLSAGSSARKEAGVPCDPPEEWDSARKSEWVRNHLVEFIGQVEFFESLLDEPLFMSAAGSARAPQAGPAVRNPASVPVVTGGEDLSDASGLPSLDAFGDSASERLFAFEITDRSMAPVYEPGTAVVFSADRPANPGDRIVAGLTGGKAVCRVLRRKGDWIQLVPLNPSEDPLFLKEGELRWMHPVVRSFGR